jgi:signal transduction histidine kinase
MSTTIAPTLAADHDTVPLRILIIDDNTSIHDDFRKILMPRSVSSDLDALEEMLFDEVVAAPTGPNYEIDAASQGEEGRDMVQRSLDEGRPYALAFVDMRMPPGWDGVETIQQLWKVDPNLQVVICSAYSDYSWDEMTDHLGQSDRLLILKKPFDNIEVSQLATAMTEKWKTSRTVRRQMDELEVEVVRQTRCLHDVVSQLKSSQQLLNSTIDSLSSCIAILDRDGVVVATNANWRNSDESNPFVRSTIDQCDNYAEACLVAGPDRRAAELTTAIQNVLSGQTDKSSLEYSCDSATGEQRWFSVTITHFRMGDAIKVVVAHQVITELKTLQGLLAHAQKLEAVGQLAAGVAHEINTPLQYVGGSIRFLQDSFKDLLQLVTETAGFVGRVAEGDVSEDAIARMQSELEAADLDYLTEEIPEAFSQSIQGLDRVAKIVGAMKEFSHPGQEGKTNVDLNHAIESTITVAASEWKHVAEVVNEFDRSLPLVKCFPSELNQVFLNLLVNAAHAVGDVVGDASEGKGKITIVTRCVDDHVEIRLTDTGTGIPKHARERVFDPFFTTKEVGKGTGQGLSMAHAIITDKHKGRIYFETAENIGTTFVIELPLESE